MNDICGVIRSELTNRMFLGGMCLDVRMADNIVLYGNDKCLVRFYDGNGYAHSEIAVSIHETIDYEWLARRLVTLWALQKYLRNDES